MHFWRPRFICSLFLSLSTFAISASARYNDALCCATASSANAWSPRPTPSQAIICGQQYNASNPAAPSLYVPYSYCKSECGGFGLSQGSKPSSWAAPIVQFILPAVIFSISIPRRKMLAVFAHEEHHMSPPAAVQTETSLFMWVISLPKYALILAVLITDSVAWIAVILTLAGPMMLGGLYEAVLDWKILHYLKSDTGSQLNEVDAVELLITVVSGNLLHTDGDVNPQEEIKDALGGTASNETKRARLLGLVDSQMGYGAIVGAPVVFYLGAFVYTILDLSNNPSDQDAAISLAFGVEWMIIVHVAIIGSCVLATNNPSTASVLVGRHLPRTRITTVQNVAGYLQPGIWERLRQGDTPFLTNIFENRFQPVTMWGRGRNKKQWVQDCQAFQTLAASKNAEQLILGWWAKCWIFIGTTVLINLPPVAGAVVAWRTPPVGWGCRSLSFVCYGAVQLVVTTIFIWLHVLPSPGELDIPKLNWKTLLGFRAWFWYWVKAVFCGAVYLLFLLSCLGSLFVVMGGTLMQVIGVYRNCFCYVNSPQWYHLDTASVQVASDTLAQRNSSQNWVTFGGTATAFMGFCCLFGWWYQAVIRGRYKEIVYSRFGG